MGGLKARLRAILSIARAAHQSPRSYDQEIGLSLIIRLAERTILPSEAEEAWRRR